MNAALVELNLNMVDLVAALAEEEEVVDFMVAQVLKVEKVVAVRGITATKQVTFRGIILNFHPMQKPAKCVQYG